MHSQKLFREKLGCCQGFSALIQNIGEKGGSVVAAKNDGDRNFYFHVRPLDHSIESAIESEQLRLQLSDLRGQLVSLPVGLATRLNFLISFCPFCGSSLIGQIQREIETFDALAEFCKPHF